MLALWLGAVACGSVAWTQKAESMGVGSKLMLHICGLDVYVVIWAHHSRRSIDHRIRPNTKAETS